MLCRGREFCGGGKYFDFVDSGLRVRVYIWVII